MVILNVISLNVGWQMTYVPHQRLQIIKRERIASPIKSPTCSRVRRGVTKEVARKLSQRIQRSLSRAAHRGREFDRMPTVR